MPHEASAAHTRCPGTLESERAGSQANRVAPGARPSAARGGAGDDGAMVLSQDEIDGSAPASSALRLLSSVKNGAALCQTDRSLFRTERERTPRTVEGSDGGAPTTRRARSSLASETQTKRNAPRRHTHRVTPPPVTQAAATPSSPSTRTEVARSTSGSCGRCSRPWARSRPRRSSSR